MPFFMDIHVGEEALDLKVVRELHQMDKAIEHKYGVSHLHYYVNVEEGMGFCLLSGPDKETCAKVHRESHGNVASNIIEVQETTYECLMGKVSADDSDMVQTINGVPDSAYRYLLFLELVGIHSGEAGATDEVLEVISKNGGRLVESKDRSLVVSFTDCNQALYCANGLIQLVPVYSCRSLDLKIGLATGIPVTNSGTALFEEAIELTARLARMAPPGLVFITNKVAGHFNGNLSDYLNSGTMMLINNNQLEFINRLFRYLDLQIREGFVSVNSLYTQMGVSRAQLYRKVRALSRKSPKEFIREFRLCQACKMINSGDLSISEIAYDLGYSQPTILSREFRKRFGQQPSKARKLSSASQN